jgi:hypothetical protein
MKVIIYLAFFSSLIIGCGSASVSAEGIRESDSNFNNYAFLLPLSSAEEVMGEKAFITDSSTTVTKDATRFYCGFSGIGKDEKSGNTGKFYFLFEDYKSLEEAKKRYSDTYLANKDHEGIKVANEIGDEAYFHSENSHFYFVMVRKGNKVFDLKVNKVTSKTSAEKFEKLAREITEKI